LREITNFVENNFVEFLVMIKKGKNHFVENSYDLWMAPEVLGDEKTG
jgi:hypothetical protein